VLLAIGIALALSSSELLIKYRSNLLRDLLNVYLFIYLVLNVFFAYVAYLLIPLIPFASPVKVGSFWHSLLAGLGYALILRTKLLTVTVGKQELAVGPELLYTGLMNYVGFHLENRVHAKRDATRARLLQAFTSPELFRIALNIKINEIQDPQVKHDLELSRDEILNSKVMSEIEKTYGIIRLLIETQPDEKALTGFLQGLSRPGSPR